MRRSFYGLILLAALAGRLTTAHADLLGVNIASEPLITFINTSSTATRYDAATDLFSVDASPSTIKFTASESTLSVFSPRALKIRAIVDDSGALVSGVTGSDLVISGVVGRVVGGVTNIYSGLLLEGEVTAFGAADSGTTVDNYDLRFVVTGGLLADFFNCDTLGVQVTSEGSTFTGSFAANFQGRAKGNVGVEDRTPPTVTCPVAPIVVECNAHTGGSDGAYVTYSVTVTDTCDANPQVTVTPPSGSFFPLPAGVMTTNHTVVVTAVDAAGNTNQCTFIVTVQDLEAPQFDDNENPVVEPCNIAELTFCTAPGLCYAPVTLPVPVATDDCTATPTVTVTATDQQNVVIPLSFSAGSFSGHFPKGSNSVTVVATDGHGNSVQSVCPVIVNDCEPPEILCENYTVVATNCVTEVDDDEDDRGCHGHWRRRHCRRHHHWWNCHDAGDDESGEVVRKAAVTLPPVSDNCDAEVFVQSDPPVGTLLGAGQHVVNVTAYDSSGNTNQCCFTITVLPGLQVKFRPPLDDDNRADNVETDADVRNRFTPGCVIPHKVTLHDICTGADVTCQLRGLVTVTLDVTERQGSYTDSTLYMEIDENPCDTGDQGTLMYPVDGMYFYLLRTRGYEAGTVHNDRFFRSDVKVYYNTHPDVVVGREDATLESRGH